MTVRYGSEVKRSGFSTLGEALANARMHAEGIIAEPPLKEAKAIRDYAPARRTKARIEISGRGLVRPPVAGVDVKGDNSTVGYSGAVRRRAFRPRDLDGIFKQIERELGDE